MNNIIYVHIPKTGGVTVNDSLIKQGYINKFGHQFASKIKEKIGNSFDNNIKFTVVRNPWDRLVSVYTFLTKGSEIHRPPEYQYFKPLNINTFTEFIEYLYDHNKDTEDVYILKNNPTHDINLYTLNQTNWVLGDGELLIDYICKLDNLKDGIIDLNKKYGLNILLGPHKNKTNHKHYTEMYSEKTKDIVYKLYKKDIEYFNFEF